MTRAILVTGGSRGIGAATAVAAAQRGYDVCFSYREAVARAKEVASQIEAAGRKALAVQADVAVEADVLRLFATLDERFGRLDALVNNAGIVGGASPVAEVQPANLERLWATNITGTFVCAREAVRRMSTQRGGKGGAIVNVSSAAAKHGAPGEFVHYAASKGAIDTFTIGLAKEVADQGIRVNAVRPGMIETEIHASAGVGDRLERIRPTVPMKRIGSPAEVAAAILWLLSDEASYVTAAILDVGGGR
jgi:NAD(P)-dependent dehydrogenase (short-subunit alcohol dehydrogenase family)